MRFHGFSRLARNLAVALAVASLVVLALPVSAWATGQNVSGNVILNASFTENVSSGVIVSYQVPATVSSTLSYGNGTASNQVDTLYAKQLTLTGATQTIDLTSLTDPAGNSINFARVRELIVVNTATTAGYDVKVEAGASNGWAVLPPSSAPVYTRYSGTLRISDPVSTGGSNGNVVSGTSKTITFDPGANTIVINVLIVGGSAAFCPGFLLLFISRRRPPGLRRAA